MKLFICLIFVFLHTEPTLQSLREHYALVGLNEQHVNEILKNYKSLHSQESLAYAAGAEMASAQYKFGPVNKLTSFSNGRKKLEVLVKQNEANVEIRFIRYSIQLKCPAFLGYNKNLKEDRGYILQQMKTLRTKDPNLYVYITSFLMLNAPLNAAEKTMLLTI